MANDDLQRLEAEIKMLKDRAKRGGGWEDVKKLTAKMKEHASLARKQQATDAKDAASSPLNLAEEQFGDLQPTDQDIQSINALVQNRFTQGSELLQRQASRLSAGLSGSAAARGLASSSIGLGQQGLLGQRFMSELGSLQSNLQAQGMQTLQQLPFQRAQVYSPFVSQQAGFQYDYAQREIDRTMQRDEQRRQERAQSGFGFNKLVGAAAGAAFGPVGAWAGSQIGGAFSSPTPSGYDESTGTPYRA
jgi:hypothetical protein